MNERYLFRGMRADTKEFVYGQLLITGKEHHLGLRHLIAVDEGSCVRYAGLDMYEVIPETIGQFTGLTDKNGVKVFEGDVIEWYLGKHFWQAEIKMLTRSNTLYAIEMFHNVTTDENDNYTYQISDSRKGSRNELEFLNNNFKVVGNIHTIN